MNELMKKYIERSGYKLKYIADKLGITYVGLHNKLYGKYEFTVSEAYKMKELLNISDEDFDPDEINEIVDFLQSIDVDGINYPDNDDIRTRDDRINVVSGLLSQYNFDDNAGAMLETATQLRDRYTEALTYSSVQQYPEQAEAIQREIDNLTEGILNGHIGSPRGNTTLDTQGGVQPDVIENTVELDPTIENRLLTIIELLQQLVDLKYYSVDPETQNKVIRDLDSRQDIYSQRRRNEEIQENDQERNARDHQARQNINSLVDSRITQTINQLNTRLTRLDNTRIQEIINDFNNSHPNHQVTFNSRNKRLNFEPGAFNAVGNINDEYQQLISTIEEAANQADLFNNKVYTNDPSPQSRYDQMAASLTNAADLLGSMISLNATLGNTIDDLVNADFSSLIGDISALSMSLGNGVNTLLQLKKSMGER